METVYSNIFAIIFSISQIKSPGFCYYSNNNSYKLLKAHQNICKLFSLTFFFKKTEKINVESYQKYGTIKSNVKDS